MDMPWADRHIDGGSYAFSTLEERIYWELEAFWLSDLSRAVRFDFVYKLRARAIRSPALTSRYTFYSSFISGFHLTSLACIPQQKIDVSLGIKLMPPPAQDESQPDS